MADTIIRLKVESSEYEQKLKRASQSLLQMAENAKRTGAALDLADKEEVEFVRSLGKLQTTATTTRGKVNELSNAYVELSAHYRDLDEATKKSSYGQSLMASLDELKARTQQTKNELSDINKELNDSGQSGGAFSDVLSSIAGKLGINIGSLSKMGVALGAAGAAIKVAKDAFMNSETNIDSWARIVESAKGSYSLFLDTINGGNWSSFFQNFREAIRTSKELADALDRMESISGNNTAAVAIKKTQIQELRARKQKGDDVDDELQQAVEELYNLQMEEVEATKTAAMKKMTNVISSKLNGINGSDKFDFSAEIDAFITDLITNGQDAYDKQSSIYDSLTQKSQKKLNAGTFNETTVQDLAALNIDELKSFIFSEAVTTGETSILDGLRLYAEAIQKAAGITKEEVKGISYVLSESKTLAEKNSEAIKNSLPVGSISKPPIDTYSIFSPDENSPSGQSTNNSIKGKEKEMMLSKMDGAFDNPVYVGPIESDANKEFYKEVTNESISAIGDLVSAMGTVEKGLEQMGIRLPESMSRLTNVISGAIAVIQGVNAGVDAVKTIIDIVAMFGNGGIVHAANGFAVPGTSYSGDKVPALLNSGELVLNRAQQGNLAAQLSEAMPTGSSSSLISGEQILIVINNHLRRIGRGEILTTKS